MNTILTIQAITFLANLGFGSFVLLKNIKSKINIFFGLFTASIAAWNLSLFLTLTEAGLPLFWGRLAFSFGSLGIMFIALFAIAFPYEDTRYKLKRNIILFLGIAVALIAGGPLMVKDVWIVNSEFIEGERVAVFYMMFALHFLGFLLYSLVRLIAKYKKSAYVQKTQLRYAILGVSAFLVPTLATQLILPAMGIFKYNNIGPVWTIPMIAIISYSIVRHQLMDIRVAIQKGILYSVLSAFVVGVYLAGIQTLGYLFGNTTNVTIVLSGAFATVVGVISAPWVKWYFGKLTNPIFFKDTYIFSEALQELSHILGGNTDMQSLLEKVLNALRNILNVQKAHIVLAPVGADAKNRKYKIYRYYSHKDISELKGGSGILTYSEIPYLLSQNRDPKMSSKLKRLQQYLATEDVEIVVPILLQDALLGLLVLSNKLSEDPYTKEDIRLLNIFSRQAAVAIRKAELYQQVKEYSQDLEKKVAERTEKVRKLQKEQEQMIIEISHELQTPLSVIKLQLEALKEDGVERPYITQMDYSVDRISKFIYDFMHLVRMDTEESDWKKERVSLSGLLNDLAEYLGVLTREQDIKLSADIKEDVFVRGDSRRLEEAITNIVGNAIKYMPGKKTKKERCVSITMRKEGKRAVINISDTGAGIKKDDLPFIFDRFYRSSVKDLTDIKGVGLGLAIAKKIVEKHKGEISAESREGKGTDFTISLPAA